MLHRCVLHAMASCFSGKNRCIITVVHCSTSSYNSLHKPLKETKCIDTMQMEKEIKTVKLTKEENRTERKRKKPTIQNMNHAVVNHVQSIHPDIVDVCPNNFMKTLTTNTNVLYLIDEKTATKYVSLIIKDLLKNTCFVAELNPGFGILTEKLLQAGVPLIHLYEAKKELYTMLEKIHNIYPDQLDIKNINLLNIAQMLYRDRHTDGKEVQEVLQDVKHKKWEDETYMQIIGATNSSSFFRHLINSLIFRNSFMTNGRPVFYIVIPPSFYHVGIFFSFS